MSPPVRGLRYFNPAQPRKMPKGQKLYLHQQLGLGAREEGTTWAGRPATSPAQKWPAPEYPVVVVVF